MGALDSTRPPKDPQETAPTPWWEGKLCLLVLGFVLTGVLGPWLQYVQKRLEWNQQVAYEIYNKQISSMRDGRGDLADIYVGYSKLFDATEGVFLIPPGSEADRRGFAQFVAASAEDRARAYAKVELRLRNFENPEPVRVSIEQAMQAWAAAIASARTLAQDPSKRSLQEQAKQQFGRSMQQFRNAYRQAKIDMEHQIGKFEDEHKQRFF